MFDEVGYRTSPERFDEALDTTGGLRPSWSLVERVVGPMSPDDLSNRQAVLDRLMDAESAGHLVDARRDQVRPWSVDPLPLVLHHDDFRPLVEAVLQRVQGHEAVLADLHGEQSLITAGVVPARAVYGLTSFHTTMPHHRPPRWLVHAAVDVVRTASGAWKVVADHTDTPNGLAAALINRAVMARVLPQAVRHAGVTPLAGALTAFRRALAAVAPAGRTSPRTVVLCGGPDDPAYVEHSSLAVQMGVHLVQGGDLVVRRQRVWLRALEGLEPVDVIARGVPDQGLDPLAARSVGTQGVPALSWAAQAGGVALANPRGSRLIEEAALRVHLGDAVHHLTGHHPALDVVTPGEPLATTPVYDRMSGRVLAGHVVLRLQVVVGPDGTTVMPGASCRVVAEDGHETSRGDTLKDLWVVGTPASERPAVRVAPPPQVDLGGSLPKRAADALYWLGRAGERAEVAARAARTVGAQLEDDPSLSVYVDGQWTLGAIGLLRASRSLPMAVGDDPTTPLPVRLDRELAAVPPFVGTQLVTLAQEAASVREYLSSTTARVLGRLAHERADLLGRRGDADELDGVIVDLAALAGLATESMVRGPAWRLMDLGRRLERALAVLGSVEATLGPAVDPFALQPLAESVLAANESLIAYRRRHRSDVELDAVLAFLLHDDTNPRSLAFQLDRLREHMAALTWPEGADLVQRASIGALHHTNHSVVSGRRLEVDAVVLAARGPLLDLGEAIVERWFADPVNPMVLTPRGHR